MLFVNTYFNSKNIDFAILSSPKFGIHKADEKFAHNILTT